MQDPVDAVCRNPTRCVNPISDGRRRDGERAGEPERRSSRRRHAPHDQGPPVRLALYGTRSCTRYRSTCTVTRERQNQCQHKENQGHHQNAQDNHQHQRKKEPPLRLYTLSRTRSTTYSYQFSRVSTAGQEADPRRRQPPHVLQLLRAVLLRALSSHRHRLLHLVSVQHHNHHVVLLLRII